MIEGISVWTRTDFELDSSAVYLGPMRSLYEGQTAQMDQKMCFVASEELKWFYTEP